VRFGGVGNEGHVAGVVDGWSSQLREEHSMLKRTAGELKKRSE
jgi:hypothetical protein